MASTALALARTTRQRLVALSVLLALVVGGIAAAIASAGAAPSAQVIGVTRGEDVFGTSAALGDQTVHSGLYELFLDGLPSSTFAYGVELGQGDGSGSYEAQPWSTTGVANLDVVRYIVTTYAPSGGFLSPAQAAGIQAAIWNVTDGFQLGGSTFHPTVPANGNSQVAIDTYDLVLADIADGGSLPEPAPVVTVTGPATPVAVGQPATFTIGGTDITGITVALTGNTAGAQFVDCATLAPTAPSVPTGGDVCVVASTPGDYTVEASGTGPVNVGTVLVHPDPSVQALMLAKGAPADADASASATVITDEGSITVRKLVEGSSGAEGVWNFELRDNSGTVVRTGSVDAITPVITWTGLPTAGSPYTVTEVGSSATSTVVSSSGVTVVPGGNVDVTVTNRYEGQFTVTKAVTGDLVPAAGTTYEFSWACTAAQGQSTGSGTFVLVDGGTFTSPMVLAGSSCTIAETNANGGTASVQVGTGPTTPGGTVTVTISHGAPQAVTVTNTFPEAARLTVNKATTGPVTGPFEVTVVCTFNGSAVATGAEGGVTFSPSSPWVSPLLPVGSECTVTETGQGNAETVSVTPTGGLSGSGDVFTEVTLPIDGATVTFTNSRAPLQATGQLSVSKAVTGTVTGTFTFTVSCPGVTLPAADATFTLAAGTSRTLGVAIPAGTTCTVTETTRGDAASTTVSVNGGAATTPSGATPAADVTITVDATATVAFTNVREDLPTTTTTAPPTTTTTAPSPSTVAATTATTTAPSSSALAFTGGNVGLLVLAGGGMLAMGVALRVATTRRRIEG
jgi:hypothetical protein